MILFLSSGLQRLAGVAAGAHRRRAARAPCRRACAGGARRRCVCQPCTGLAGWTFTPSARALRSQPEGELERMDADAFGFEHRAGGLALVAVVAPHFLGARACACRSRTSRASRAPRLRRHGELLGPVREVEVAAVVARRSRSASSGCLKFSKPPRISASSCFATSRPQRSIHCERFSRPLAFWPWPPLRLEQPHEAWLASSTVAWMPCSCAR